MSTFNAQSYIIPGCWKTKEHYKANWDIFNMGYLLNSLNNTTY